jgi:hypothetical protein
MRRGSCPLGADGVELAREEAARPLGLRSAGDGLSVYIRGLRRR